VRRSAGRQGLGESARTSSEACLMRQNAPVLRAPQARLPCRPSGRCLIHAPSRASPGRPLPDLERLAGLWPVPGACTGPRVTGRAAARAASAPARPLCSPAAAPAAALSLGCSAGPARLRARRPGARSPVLGPRAAWEPTMMSGRTAIDPAAPSARRRLRTLLRDDDRTHGTLWADRGRGTPFVIRSSSPKK